MMEFLASGPGHMVVLVPLFPAAGYFVLQLLPLVSDRANERAVRMIKAKNQQSE